MGIKAGATYVVDVVSRGLKSTGAGLANLGRDAARAATEYNRTNTAARDFHNTQAKGVIGTANSTKSFSKLAETMNGGSGIVGAYATLAANVFAVSAAFNALRNAAQVEQVLAGLEASGARTGLTLTNAAKSVKELSGNLLSTEQAMRSTSQVLAAGFSTKELERLTVVAKDASFALGRPMQDSMDRLTRGIVKLEPELLDELGIMTKLTESNRNVASSLGKSETALTSFEKRQGFLNAVLSEGELKFGKLSEEAGTTTNYDKLAATFSDLSKTIFNSINNMGMNKLVGWLASSPTALFGVMLLFVSTLKGQLVPGMLRMAEASRVEAAATQHAAKEKLKKMNIDIAAAKVANMSGVTAAAAGVAPITQGPAKFNQLTAALKTGTFQTREYDAAMLSLNRSLSMHNSQLANGQYDAAAMARKQGIITQIQAQIAALTALKAAQDAANLSSAGSAAAGAAAHTAYKQLTRQATAQTIAATALGVMGQGVTSIIPGFVLGGRAIAAYATTVGMATTSMGTFAAVARTASFAVVTSLKLIGTTILTLLPWIGMAVVAWSLLAPLFKTKLTPAQEEYNKKLEALQEILDKVNNKVNAYNRIQQSTASASERAAQRLTLQANAIIELAAAYDELAIASKAAAASEANKGAEDAEKARLAANSNKGYAERGMSVNNNNNQDSKMLSAAAATELSVLSTTIKTFSTIAAEGGKDGENLLKTLGAMEKLDPVGFNKFVDKMGGDGVIKTRKYADQLKIAEAGVASLADKHTRAKSALDAVISAFTAGDKAAADFMTGSIPTTPFDALAESAQQSAMAISNMEIEMQRGNVTALEFVGALSGIGGKFQQIMSVDASRTIDEFKRLESAIQNFKKANPIMDESQKIYLQGMINERNGAARDMSITVQRELNATAKITQQLQEQTRILDGQAKLYQAQLSTVQGIYDLNGKGMAERFEQEEKVREAQVQRIKLEMTIQDNILAQNALKLEQLRLDKEMLYVRTLDRAAEERMLKINAETDPTKKMGMLMNTDILKEAKKEAELQSREIDNQIASVELAGRATRAVIANMKNEVATLYAQNYSELQKQARISQKNYEVSQKYVELLKQQAGLLTNISVIQNRFRALAKGDSSRISSDLAVMQAQLATSKKNLMVEYRNKVEGILRAREVTKADVARAAAEGLATAAGNEAIANAGKEIIAEEKLMRLRAVELDLTTKLEMIERVRFDTRTEGLNWQKESLSYVERELELTGELKNTLLKNNQMREQTKLMGRNIPISESFTQGQEIETKIQAYDLAVKEFSLRSDMIDLEFALLDAQRVALAEELKQRKFWLLQTTKMTEDSTAIRQLSSAINNLENVDNLDALKNIAKRNLREGIETQRLGLEQASIPMNEGLNKFQNMTGEFLGLLRLQGAQQAARAASDRQIVEGVSRVTAKFDNNAIPVEIPGLAEDLQKAIPVMSATEAYLKQISEDVHSMVNGAAAGTSGVSGVPKLEGTLYERLSQFKSWVEKTFPGVRGELEQHGGASGNRRAIDFNVGTNNIEWNKPEQKAILTKIAQAAVDAGLGTLWGTIGSEFNKRGVGGHEDHLHVDGPQNAAATNVARSGASPRMGAANDNAQVVPAILTLDPSTEASITKEADDILNRAGTFAELQISAAIDMESSVPGITETISQLTKEIKPLEIPAIVKLDLKQSLMALRIGMQPYLEELKKLGPQGEMVASFAGGMADMATAGVAAFDKIAYAIQTANTASASGEHKMKSFQDATQAGLAVASAGVGMITGIVNAGADAKVAAVDKEIAAEQKRDGKSAESVAKIQALEQRKDAIERKRFNTNKKLQMANAIINTASGITSALSLPPPMNFIMSGIIGAMGAAQLAIISGTQYQSTSSPNAAAKSMPQNLTIGKRGDGVDVNKHNQNVGGELGYLRGSKGSGSNSSNYATIGSAYGGPLPRGYGNTSYVVGEKGPEVIERDTPITVRPMNDNENVAPANANFTINAVDGESVQKLLINRRGDIIDMLREAANASGGRFMEDVNTNHYKKAGGGATRI